MLGINCKNDSIANNKIERSRTQNHILIKVLFWNLVTSINKPAQWSEVQW